MQDVKIGRTDWKEVGHEVYFMGGMPFLGPNLGFGFLDDALHVSILLGPRGDILLPWNAITNIEWGLYIFPLQNDTNVRCKIFMVVHL